MTLLVGSEDEACGPVTGEGTPSPVRSSGPAEPLYHSPLGIFPHQIEGVAHVLGQAEGLTEATLARWDTGLGKTHLDMISTAMLVEDPAVDLFISLVVCESDKVDEWVEDFTTFTKLRVCKYGGKDPKARRRVIDRLDDWDVLVATYETFRNDMAVKVKERNAKGRMVVKLAPGPLTEACAGKLVKVGWDEINKLGNRGSDNHKAHKLFVDTVAKTGGKVIMEALTATPIETGVDDLYNLGRILVPDRMPTVAHFEEWYVAKKDSFGRYINFKNLSADKMTPVYDDQGNQIEVVPFRDLWDGVIVSKSKSDPDVRDFFPPLTEEYEYVHLGERHQSFYKTVVETFEGCDPITERALFMVLRQIAGCPQSLLRSEGKVATAIVETVGAQGLAALGNAKLDRLVHYLVPVVRSGQQAIVFTFFGPSMGPFIAEALEAAKMRVGRFFGPDKEARAAAKAAFRAGDLDVLVSSDAGSRGLNLPEATYIINYDLPLTHARYIQRLSRASRLGEPGQPLLTVQSFVAYDTIEEGIVTLGHRRNEWGDLVYEDDHSEIEDDKFVTASQRKRLIAWAKQRAA